MRSVGAFGIVAAMALSIAGGRFGDGVIGAARPRRDPLPEPAREKTRYDLSRIGAAERKRARKAAKLRDTTEQSSRSGRDPK